MRCPACDTDNLAAAKFCEGCGASLGVPCPGCGLAGARPAPRAGAGPSPLATAGLPS